MICAADYPSRRALRKHLRQTRRRLSRQQQRQAAHRLKRQLLTHPLFRRAKHIALYLPNDAEIDPRPLLRSAQQRGKHLYLPRLCAWPQTRMVFQRITTHERLYPNRFGILEPPVNPKRWRPVWALNLLLLPLVGFDPTGGRLGMGGGFYDRCLAFRHRQAHLRGPTLLGLAHECQKVDRLPLERWDIELDAIVTDQHWYPQPLLR